MIGLVDKTEDVFCEQTNLFINYRYNTKPKPSSIDFRVHHYCSQKNIYTLSIEHGKW
jgi:hypothetical protein